jgi:hypothetical protein
MNLPQRVSQSDVRRIWPNRQAGVATTSKESGKPESEQILDYAMAVETTTTPQHQIAILKSDCMPTRARKTSVQRGTMNKVYATVGLARIGFRSFSGVDAVHIVMNETDADAQCQHFQKRAVERAT